MVTIYKTVIEHQSVLTYIAVNMAFIMIVVDILRVVISIVLQKYGTGHKKNQLEVRLITCEAFAAVNRPDCGRV